MPETPNIDINRIDAESNYTPKVQFDSLPMQPFVNAAGPMPVLPSGEALSQSTSLDSFNDQIEAQARNNNKPKQGGTDYYAVADVKDPKHSNFLPGYDNEALYHAGQSGWDRAGNAIVNFAGKAVAYTGQAAGFIGGAPGAVVGWDISNMTDNWLVKASDSLKETVQDNFPIYKGTTYEKGSIWQKLGTSDWWLDDAIDRAALTASMFVPGFVEAKGFGLFGAAVDEAGLLRPTGLISKALTKIAENPENYGAIGKRFLPALYEAATKGTVDGALAPALANYAKKLSTAELYSWNIIGQSALNGREAQQSIRKGLKEQREAGQNQFTDDEIEQKAADGAIKGFAYTLPLTLVGSLIELPQMFSSVKGSKSMLNKLFNSQTGEALEGGLASTLAATAPKWYKTVGKALLTGLEHGQNESAQVAVGRYIEDSVVGKKDEKTGKWVKDERSAPLGIYEDFKDNINDPNGQNNIALGTIQGILTTFGGRAVRSFKGETKREQEHIQSTFDRIQKAKLDRRFYNEEFTKRDEFGKVVLDKDGKPQFDQEKLANVGVSLGGAQEAIYNKFQALQNNDTIALEKLNHDSVAALAYNFLGDPKGMQHLEGLLTIAAKNEKENNVDRENDVDELDAEITPERQLAKNLDIARNLKKVYDAIEQRHAGFTFLDIDKNSAEEKQAASGFIQNVKWAQYKAASDQTFLNRKANENSSAINSIASTEGITDLSKKIDDPVNPMQEKFNDLLDEKQAINLYLDNSKLAYKDLIDKKKVREAFKQSISKAKEVADNAENIDNSDSTSNSSTKAETTKIKSSNGSQDIEVGSEYYLSSDTPIADKDAYSSKFTVLKKNTDGTISIKDNDGTIRDISEEEFKDYRVTKVDNNSKSNFYNSHSNDTFEYTFGYKKKEGKLSYNPSTKALSFNYKDAKGENISTEVTADQFKGKNAQIKKIGNSTEEQSKNLSKFTSEKDSRISEKRTERLKVFGKLIDSSINNLERVNKLIDSKSIQVNKIAQDISSLEEKIAKPDFTKRGNLKKAAKLALASASNLSNLKNSLEDEITSLESEREQIEFNLSYYQDTINNLDSLPTKNTDLIKELKQQISDSENLTLAIGNQLSGITKVISSIEEAIDVATSLIRSTLSTFFNRYKNVPGDLNSAEWVEFLNNNPNFLKLQPNYKADLKYVEDFIQLVEDSDITPNEKQLAKLADTIKDLNSQLDLLGKEQIAKEEALKSFDKEVQEFKKEQEQKEKLAKNNQAKQQIDLDQKKLQDAQSNVPTGDNRLDIINSSEREDAKVSVHIATAITAESSEEYDTNPKSYTVRKRVFFNNADSMPNRDSFRAIVITANQEQAMGLTGLMDAMYGDSNAQTIAERTNADNGLIAVVYVSETPQGTFYINEKGEQVGKYGEEISKDTIRNQMMYSAMRTTELTDSKGNPRYRTQEKEQYEALMKDWKAKREILFNHKFDKNSNPMPSYKINLSRGLPIENENGVTNSVVGALINKKQLDEKDIIVISDTGDIQFQGKNIKFPAGRPVLRIGSTLEYLNNRNLTNKEQELVYNLFTSLAKEFSETYTLNTEITSFLNHLLYWGKSNKEKATGRNQVFIERDPISKNYMLSLGKEKSFIFTEANLKDPAIAAEVKAFLSTVYNNVNNSTLNKNFEKEFTEVTGIKEENGKTVLEKRVWKNYQRYLLSDTYDDNTKRSSEDIPLSTTVRPINKDITGDYNFKQKYAILDGMELPVPVKKVQVTQEDKQKEVSSENVTTQSSEVNILAVKPTLTNVNEITTAEVGKIIRAAEKNNGTIEQSINQYALFRIGKDVSENKIEATSNGTMFVNVLGFPINFDITEEGNVILPDAMYKAFEDNVKAIAKSLEEKKEVVTPTPIVEQAAPYGVIAADYLFTAGSGGILSTDYLIQGLSGSFPAASSLIESIRNKYIKSDGDLGNIKDVLDTDLYKNIISEVKDAINKTYNSPEINNILEEILKYPTGLPVKLGNQLSIQLDKLTENKIEEDKAKTAISISEPITEEVWTPSTTSMIDDDSIPFSRVTDTDVARLTQKDIKVFRDYMKKNLPNAQYEMLEDMISIAGTDRFAWGKLQGNLLSIFKDAKRGTEYHEAFEYVYNNLLTPEKQQELIDELASKKGTFYDAISQSNISFSEANTNQLKERLADMFAEFRLNKVDRSFGQKVKDFFNSIVDFIRKFIFNKTNNSKIDALFNEIDKGKFKDTKSNFEDVSDESNIHYARAGLYTEKQTNEMVQHISVMVIQNILKEGGNTNLFNIIDYGLSNENQFEKVKNQLIEKGKLPTRYGKISPEGEQVWNQLKSYTKDFMRTLNMNIQDDELSINEEGKTRNDYVKEAFLTNTKLSAPAGFKLRISSLIKRISAPLVNNKIELLKGEESSVGGYTLLNSSKTFAVLLNKLSNSYGLESLVNKLVQLAESNTDYVELFKSIGGNLLTKEIDFINLSVDDIRMLSQFFGTMSKQRPNATIMSNDNGDNFIQNAVLAKPSDSIKQQWINNIRNLSQKKDSYITFNREEKRYDVKPSIKDIPIRTVEEQLAFLEKIGIQFDKATYDKLSKKDKDTNFPNAISAIRKYIGENGKIATIEGNSLGIGERITYLAEKYSQINMPDYESTYSDISGKMRQQDSEHNGISKFTATFNSIQNLNELKEKMPWLNDTFSENSLILKEGGLYFNEDGTRTAIPINIGYVQGTRDQVEGKAKSTSDLTIAERSIQEINHNLGGTNYILVPADSSTEWTLSMPNQFSYSDLASNTDKFWKDTYETFTDYLLDEIALAQEDRSYLKNTKPRAKELRFFKDILSEDLVNEANKVINGEVSLVDFLINNEGAINKSIKDFLQEKIDKRIQSLKDLGEIDSTYDEKSDKDNFTFPNGLNNFFSDNKLNKLNLTEEELNNIFTVQQLNYTISNIEMHKVFFGDPYAFAIKVKDGKSLLDETKRIKGSLSPRRSMLNHPMIDKALNQKSNFADKDNKIQLKEEDPGFNKYRSYFNAITTVLRNGIEDIVGSQALNDNLAFSKVTEADAASWITISKYREILQKSNGQWTKKAEDWYQWEMAYTRQELAKKGKYTYDNKSLEKHDSELIQTPKPKYALKVLKPVATGSKFASKTIDQIYHKTSQMPMYYSLVQGRAMEDMYTKMLTEKNENGETNDYLIMISGVKVGAEQLHDIYDEQGFINKEAFNNLTQVDLDSYGIQVETEAEGHSQTMGSQLTKEVSLDLLSSGQPLDYTDSNWNELTEDQKQEVSPIYKLAKHNQALREEMISNGYNNLLDRMGIVDEGDGYILIDAQKLSDTLYSELTRRDASDNLKESLKIDPTTGGFSFPFEASNSYGIIKNVLYSMVNKEIVQPSVNGGAHVQVPATMWENAKEGRSLALKTKDGYKKISREEFNNLSDEEKKKVALTSDSLKFYTKEEPWMEVMLPMWFKDKIKKSKKLNKLSDDELIKYLNNTEDGKKVLEAIGFRIPTQGHNSMEVMKVKAFINDAMNHTIVVPSEITTKSGSDFDIDKLNTYLKNVYIDSNGDLKIVPYFGTGNQAIDKFKSLLVQEAKNKASNLEGARKFKDSLLEAIRNTDENLQESKRISDFIDKNADLFSKLYEDDIDSETRQQSVIDDIVSILKKQNELSDKELQAFLVYDKAKKMYNESLQNEYYDSIKNILQLEQNYDRLVTPIDDPTLQDLAGVIADATNDNESSIKARLLDQVYMQTLRDNFLTGKKWVGIAATAITGHSLMQRFRSIVDVSKLDPNSNEAQWLGDGTINFAHNTTEVNGKTYSTLSGLKTQEGKFISDVLSQYANAFVDVAKDPYILKVITSNFTVDTALFMTRLGINTAQIGLFLNQPIIRDYLAWLDKAKSSSRTYLTAYNNVRAIYGNTAAKAFNTDAKVLENNIREYTTNGKFDTKEKMAEQIAILNEYLKISTLADYQFKLDQATNYDTTRFRSSDAIYRKNLMTEDARNNPISSVDDLLNNSFIGKIIENVGKADDAMGQVLKFQVPEIKKILQNVLKPYAQNSFLNGEKFNTISTKIAQSFLDYIIQKQLGLTQEIERLLVNNSTNIASKITEAKVKFPDNLLLQNIDTIFSDKENGTKNIKLKVNRKEVYDQNLFTSYMRELRDNPSTRELYDDIILTGLLQGTAISPIAFTNIIPIEDYVKIVAPIIASLDSIGDLNNFNDLNLFQKNNWMYDDIVPDFKPKFFSDDENNFSYEDDFGNEVTTYSYINSAVDKTSSLKYGKNSVLLLNSRYNSKQVQYPVLKVKRIQETKSDKIDITTNLSVEKNVLKAMKLKGDTSFRDYFGYEQAKDSNGNPITYQQRNEGIFRDTGKTVIDTIYVYKRTNLLGNRQFAVEYNEDAEASQIDNGTVHVEEIDNHILEQQIKDKIRNSKGTLRAVDNSKKEVSDKETEDKIKNCLGR